LRAARANLAFCTDEKHIRTESKVMDKDKNAFGVNQDPRLRADMLFIRAQSRIRADGFSSAQQAHFTTSGARFELSRM